MKFNLIISFDRDVVLGRPVSSIKYFRIEFVHVLRGKNQFEPRLPKWAHENFRSFSDGMIFWQASNQNCGGDRPPPPPHTHCWDPKEIKPPPRKHSSNSKKVPFSGVHTRRRKRCFQKFPLWKVFSKVCVFGVRFHRIRVDGRQNRKKLLRFQTKTDTCVFGYERLK